MQERGNKELRGEARHKKKVVDLNEMKWVVGSWTAGGWKKGKRMEGKRAGLYYGE